MLSFLQKIRVVNFGSWRRPGLRRLRPLLPAVTILIWIVRLSAAINLLAAILPHPPAFMYWLAPWMPFQVSVGRRVRMLITAVLLFVLSSGLERGKKVAWAVTIAVLTVAPLIHFGRTMIWPQFLLNLPLIILLWLNRHYFVARSHPGAIRFALIICPLLLFGLIVFGTIRLHELRFETSGPDSWGGCLQACCELVLVQNAYTQTAQTEQTYLFFSVLRITGVSIILVGLYLTLRPSLLIRGGAQERRNRAARILEEYGVDWLTAYAMQDDKSFFVDSTGEAVIAYVVSSRYAITLADPVGALETRERTITEFSDFCRAQDWTPIFYEIIEEMLPVYRRLGFSAFQIGEDASFNPQAFDLKGGSFQNLRTLCNKARREGYHFRWYDESCPIDEKLEGEISSISQTWLELKKRSEMIFDMGVFSQEELRRHGTGIALDGHGRAVAFATWRPFAQGRGRALDLMRSLPVARNIVDFVLVESIFGFRARNIHEVSLGNAPLAHASPEFAPTSVEDRLVRFIYENLNQVYAYKPLFEFKRKYRPQWRPRFLAYLPGESLPLISLALIRIHTSKSLWKFLLK